MPFPLNDHPGGESEDELGVTSGPMLTGSPQIQKVRHPDGHHGDASCRLSVRLLWLALILSHAFFLSLPSSIL